MAASPPLTIGLPVYNGERYLETATRAVLDQSFGDFVLVISDNASSDGTEDLCRSLAREDPRIRYERHAENRGGAWNFNRVARLAESEFFKWITHDDITAPGFLERCMGEMASAPEPTILCYPRTILIDADDEVIEDFDDGLDLPMPEPHRRLRSYLENYRMSNAIFGIIRRDLLMRTSLLQPYSSSDKVLMAEMALVGRFHEVPERLFLRRHHEGMSRQANVTPEEVAAWFDPQNPRPVQMQRTRLFVEYHKAIARRELGLSPAERMACVRSLYAAGGWHEMRVIGGEIKREVKIRSVRSWRALVRPEGA